MSIFYSLLLSYTPPLGLPARLLLATKPNVQSLASITSLLNDYLLSQESLHRDSLIQPRALQQRPLGYRWHQVRECVSEVFKGRLNVTELL